MKLQDGEDILMEIRPESKLLVIWFFARCFSVGVVGCVLGFVLSTVIHSFYNFGADMDLLAGKANFDGWSITVKLIIAIVVGLMCMIFVFIYCICLKRTYVYTITNRRCIFRGGILRHVQHSVPFHKITDVEMSQNIIERILGISSLGIFTPGTGSMGSNSSGRRPEIAFVGLKDNETPAEIINGILSNYKATGQ